MRGWTLCDLSSVKSGRVWQAAQLPTRSNNPGRKCACEVVRNSVGVRSAHSVANAPLRQKDAAGKSSGITREHVEYLVPASDEKMAAQRRESSKSLQDDSSGTAVRKKDFSACQRNLSRRKQVLSRLQSC